MASSVDQELRFVLPRRSVRQHLADVWRYRELWLQLVRKELHVRYQKSVLGFAWSMLNPLFLLGLALVAEAPRYCGSLPAWSPAQAARELRRRIAALEADALLRSTATGDACLAAYKYELTHTRVVLKRKASASARSSAVPC